MPPPYLFKGHKWLTDFWFEHYAGEHCTLCGNSGVIDTRAATTAAGVRVGRRNWCICPNGQHLRIHHGGALPPQK